MESQGQKYAGDLKVERKSIDTDSPLMKAVPQAAGLQRHSASTQPSILLP